MERAGKSLSKLANTATPEELAIAAWKAVIGKRLIRYAWAKALVRGNLIVETEDAVWQKQLFHLRHQILRRLASVLGDEIVHDVEFRVATPRRPPQAAEAAHTAVSADEADRIEDPVMRLIYKRARKRATA